MTCIIKVIMMMMIMMIMMTCIIKDLDGGGEVVSYSKHCTWEHVQRLTEQFSELCRVTQDNKFEFPNRSHEQSEVRNMSSVRRQYLIKAAFSIKHNIIEVELGH